jgi:SAM-dependent methyltransferase
MELLHHLNDDVPGQVLKEIKQCLEPGGRLVLDLKNRHNVASGTDLTIGI